MVKHNHGRRAQLLSIAPVNLHMTPETLCLTAIPRGFEDKFLCARWSSFRLANSTKALKATNAYCSLNWMRKYFCVNINVYVVTGDMQFHFLLIPHFSTSVNPFPNLSFNISVTLNSHVSVW